MDSIIDDLYSKVKHILTEDSKYNYLLEVLYESAAVSASDNPEYQQVGLATVVLTAGLIANLKGIDLAEEMRREVPVVVGALL